METVFSTSSASRGCAQESLIWRAGARIMDWKLTLVCLWSPWTCTSSAFPEASYPDTCSITGQSNQLCSSSDGESHCSWCYQPDPSVLLYNSSLTFTFFLEVLRQLIVSHGWANSWFPRWVSRCGKSPWVGIKASTVTNLYNFIPATLPLEGPVSSSLKDQQQLPSM